MLSSPLRVTFERLIDSFIVSLIQFIQSVFIQHSSYHKLNFNLAAMLRELVGHYCGAKLDKVPVPVECMFLLGKIGHEQIKKKHTGKENIQEWQVQCREWK